MPQPKRPSFALIYLASFLTVSAFAIMLPLLPLYGQEYGADAGTIGALVAVSPLVQLLASPLSGMLSDKFGRKPAISVGLFGMALSFLLFALAPTLFALFFARGLQGLFAGAVLPTTRAYVADLTANSERVQAMGRLSAFLALGIILGPAMGGVLGEITLALPFFFAAVLTVANALLVVFLLPESLAKKALYPLRLSQVLWRNFTSIAWGLGSSLAPLFLLAFLWSFAFSANAVAVPLLGLEKFGLGAGAIGLLFGVLGAITAVIQFGFLTKITSRVGVHRSAFLGLLLMALGLGLIPLAPAVALLYGALGVLAAGSAVTRPVITALISQETEEHQGVAMGTANAFESLGRLLGPLFGGLLFAFGVLAPFAGIALFVLLVLGYVIWKTPFLKRAT